jgi:hypothetical protein
MIHQLFIHYSCIIHPRAACGGRFIILNIMHVLCTWSFRYIEHYFYAQRHDKNLINFSRWANGEPQREYGCQILEAN